MKTSLKRLRITDYEKNNKEFEKEGWFEAWRIRNTDSIVLWKQIQI